MGIFYKVTPRDKYAISHTLNHKDLYSSSSLVILKIYVVYITYIACVRFEKNVI